MNVSLLLVVAVVLMVWKGFCGLHSGFVKELVGFISVVIWCVQLLLVVITIESFRHQDMISAVVAIAIILVFGLIHKAVKLISLPAKLATHLPLVHLCNKLAGIAVGILEAFSFLWVFFYYVDGFGTETMKTWLAGQTGSNELLSWLYANNYLVTGILYIMHLVGSGIAGIINGL